MARRSLRFSRYFLFCQWTGQIPLSLLMPCLLGCGVSFLGPTQANTQSYDKTSTQALLNLAEDYYFGAHDHYNERNIRLHSAKAIYEYLFQHREDDLREDINLLKSAVRGYVQTTLDLLLEGERLMDLLLQVGRSIETKTFTFKEASSVQSIETIFQENAQQTLSEDLIKGALDRIPKDERDDMDITLSSLCRLIVLVVSCIERIHMEPALIEDILSLGDNILQLEDMLASYQVGASSRDIASLNIQINGKILGFGDRFESAHARIKELNLQVSHLHEDRPHASTSLYREIMKRLDPFASAIAHLEKRSTAVAEYATLIHTYQGTIPVLLAP